MEKLKSIVILLAIVGPIDFTTDAEVLNGKLALDVSGASSSFRTSSSEQKSTGQLLVWVNTKGVVVA